MRMAGRSVALAMVAGSVQAAELAEEGGGSIFTGDLGNTFWTLVVFGVLVFVLGRYAWGPLLDLLKRREEFIRESLDRAKRDREEAEARLLAHADKLTEARQEAASILDEARRGAEKAKQRIEEESRREAERMLERARREITLARETAVKELYDVSGRLATEIAGRILERELKEDDHRRLIRESLAELGEAAGSRKIH